MCHDPVMANHSLSPSEVGLTGAALLTLGTEVLREALVNFDVSPYEYKPDNKQIGLLVIYSYYKEPI